MQSGRHEETSSVDSMEKKDIYLNQEAMENPKAATKESYSPPTTTSHLTSISNMPLTINSQVESWIHYFQNRGRQHMKKYLRRSTRYEEYMKKVLREEGLPEDLIYVPLIESGFSSGARSHRSAVGYWQFIRETGRRYGLKINRYIDERSDPLLSTRAAASYFKALYSLFGDWYLALAAYNTGENRVKSAVMKEKTRNFWVLADKKRLHSETRNYVPKFLAAMLISKNPAEYGFTGVEYHPPLEYDSIYTTYPLSLLKIARNLKLNIKDIRNLNPRYRTDYVPIYRGKTSLVRVPKGYMEATKRILSKSRSRVPRYVPSSGGMHVVRRGDTLSGIAHRYGVRMSALRSLNRLNRRRSTIRVGQRLHIPLHTRASSYRSKTKRRSAPIKSSSKQQYHVVKRGENLSKISNRYRISVRALKRLNKLRGSLLKVGQKLRLKEKPGSIHIVRRGDTLWRLAQKYSVSLNKLIAINALSRSAKLPIGKELIIP